jgi:hypothetical protein
MATPQINIKSNAKPKFLHYTEGPIMHPPGHTRSIYDIANEYAPHHRTVKEGSELFAEGKTSGDLHFIVEGWLFLKKFLEDGRGRLRVPAPNALAEDTGIYSPEDTRCWCAG